MSALSRSTLCGSAMSLQMPMVHFFLSVSSIPLYGYSAVCSSYLLMDSSVLFSFWHLQVKLS